MSTNPGAIVIQLILENIEEGDTDGITNNLSRLPLNVISKQHAELMLSWFLKKATECENVEAARAVLIAFEVGRAAREPLPAIVNMFLNANLSREVIAFVLKAFPEKVPIDFFVDLVNMGDDAGALRVAGLLSTFFTELSHEEWALLVKLTDNVEEEEYENQLLRAYFQTKAAETGSTSQRPTWIHTYLTGPELPTVPADIPTVAEAVDLLLADLAIKGIRFVAEKGSQENNLKEGLILQYSLASVQAKIQMLSTVKPLPPFDDTALFQEFGPVNTIYSPSSSLADPTHECVKYGGCRMLLCKEFESLDVNGDEVDIMAEHVHVYDWFRGSCDECLKKIAHRHYAVRQPLCHGGWQGCYCSFECLHEIVDNPHEQIMVTLVQEQLTTIGIRDRE